MYAAVVARDTTMDGVFVVGVKTTGIFCRPGCGAKKPRRENVEFFAGASQALHAGYRPCLRCRPMAREEAVPGWVEDLRRWIDGSGARRIRNRDLRTRGIEPARASRAFKRHFGMTPIAYARARRVGGAVAVLREGRAVTRAAGAAGFASESGFRHAFTQLFGAGPGAGAGSGALCASWMRTPLGPMLAAASEAGVCMLEFVDRRGLPAQVATLRRRFNAPVAPGENKHIAMLRAELEAYFESGEPARFTFRAALDTPGTPFQQKVWEALRTIPPGTTWSYARLARNIGQPKAVRAVARANGDNRVAILIPCHRVIGSDGGLGGYGGQVWRKQWLLEHEGGVKQMVLNPGP